MEDWFIMGGADSAIDKILGQAGETGNQEVLNQQPVQAGRVSERHALPASFYNRATPVPVVATYGEGISPLLQTEAPVPEEGMSFGEQFKQGVMKAGVSVMDVIDKIDAPTSMLYGSMVTAIKLMKGDKLSDEENEFLTRYFEETKTPLADMWKSPASFFQSMGAAIKGTWAPSEELKESYEKSFDTKAKIGFAMGNPLWYVLPGAGAIKGGAMGGKAAQAALAAGKPALTGLAKPAAAGGVKGALAKAGQVALTPAADIERGLGWLIKLPAKGTSKLAASLQKAPDPELMAQVEDIITRAGEGYFPDDVVLESVVRRNPKVFEQLTGVLTHIRLEQNLDEVPDYSRAIWEQLTMSRRREIAATAQLGGEVAPKVAPEMVVLSESERIALQQQLKKATAKVTRLEKKVTGTSIPDEIRAEFGLGAGPAHPSYRPGLPDEWRALKTAQAEETRIMQELGLMTKPDVSPAAGIALADDLALKSWKMMSESEKRAINRVYIHPVDNPVVKKLTEMFEDFPKYQGEQKFIRAGDTAKKTAMMAEAVEKATTMEEMTAAGALRAGKMERVALPRGFTEKEAAGIFDLIKNSPVLRGRTNDVVNLLSKPSKRTPEGGALYKLSRPDELGGPIVPTDSEIMLLEEVFGKRFADSIHAFGKENKALAAFLDIINFPRAIQSSLDVSNTFRQSVILTISEPKLAFKAFKEQLKAFVSEDAFNALFKRIRANPLYGKVKADGLTETHFTGGGPRGLREEGFFSRIATKLPGIKQSARAFTAYSNAIRFSAAYKYLATRPQFWNEGESKALMRLLNWETGRGPVPQKLLPFLSGIFYSAALQASRIAMPVMLVRASPAVRKLAWRHFGQFVGANMGMLATLKFTGAADIELDRRSTDFGKIRIGNTRLDPWGGFLPLARLIVRMVEGEYKTSSGEIKPLGSKWEYALRTGEMKFSPAMSLVRDLFDGETMIGDEMTTQPEDIQRELLSRLSPFIVQDITEALEEDGWTGAMVASAGIVGLGAVSYPSTAFADWLVSIENSTGVDWDTERIQTIRPLFEEAEASWEEYLNLNGTKLKRQYRIDHPEVDASLFFWGETAGLEIPEKSMPMVKKMLDDYGLTWDALPIKSPTEPYERGDKNDEQVIGDLLLSLPSDISNFYFANREIFDNRDLEEFTNQVRSMRAEDEMKTNLFNLLTYDPNSSTENRNQTKYLKEHPEVDAGRVMWNANTTRLHSTEARTILLQKLQELGIPPQAILISSGGGGGGGVRLLNKAISSGGGKPKSIAEKIRAHYGS